MSDPTAQTPLRNSDEAAALAPDSQEARLAGLIEHEIATQAPKVDRVFAGLMALEYVTAVLAAILVSSPYERATNAWVAVLLGGVLTTAPVALALFNAGEWYTRHTI